MKLKMLAKTSLFLCLVLSSSISFAEIQRMTAEDCSAKSPRKKGMSTEQLEACNDLPNSPDSFDTKVELINRKIAERATNSAGASQYCQSAKKPEPSKLPVMAAGSTGMFACDTLAMGNMKNVASSASFDWEGYINYACKDKCGVTTDFNACKNEKTQLAKTCQSIAHVLKGFNRNWSNPDHTKAIKGESSAGKVAASTNGQQATTAVGSGIKCSSEGIETVDYEACKEFQVQIDLIEGVQQVGYATLSLVFCVKMQDSQLKYSNEQNTATGALKAQGESLKMQQDMMNQRTAIEGAKLAYAYKLYTDMPRKEDVQKKCNSINATIANEQIKPDECYAAATAGQAPFAILQNQQQIEAMRSKLITIATTTGSNMLLSNLLGKRADDVDNAIAKIDAFQPADPFTTSEADAQSTYCKMNPGAATCLTGGLERTFDTMNDNVITFGEMASGTSYGATTNDTGVTSSAIADSTARTGATPVGSIIAAAAQDNSIDPSSAAKVTTDGTGETGGGGGGGGGGASGGGGGGAPAAAAGGGVAAAIAGKTPTYSGGGGGSFSVMGGFGINKKKGDGKAEDNPFGKLFGKDNAKGNGLVNFRDIASQKVGGKGDNLFDMISKRYSSVNADKRLLEYELAK